jgi:GNAT superfamily N-acetyltransferase
MKIEPLTPDRWPDLEKLFGPRGACSGCWCQYWRLPRKEFDQQKGAANRESLLKIVTSGPPPGLLAYLKDEPVGWVCVGPREDFPVLERSRVLKALDDQPVWSVVCFFIAKSARNTGVSKALMKAALNYAKTHGGRIIEGYPTPTRYGRLPDAFVYTGLESVFEAAGFTVAVRRGKGRAIWRYQLK